MIIPVKLKPFYRWPCQREGLLSPVTSWRNESHDRVSEIAIELDDARPFTCSRGGQGWGLTDETLQRMYAIGLIAPYAWIARRDALAIHVCEHMVRPWSLRAGKFFARIRQPQHPRLFGYGRAGKFFCRLWNEDGSGPTALGRIIECLGEEGLPLYRAELFPESERITGDDSSEYLFGEVDLRTPHWHFFDSMKEMRRFLEATTSARDDEPPATHVN